MFSPQYADGSLVDIDVIQTTHLGANVQSSRHNAFNLNRELVDDLRDVIVNKQRAYQRNSRLQVPPLCGITQLMCMTIYICQQPGGTSPPPPSPQSSVIRSLFNGMVEWHAEFSALDCSHCTPAAPPPPPNSVLWQPLGCSIAGATGTTSSWPQLTW